MPELVGAEGGVGYNRGEEFIKSDFDGEGVVTKDAGGWKTGWEHKVRRVVQASHAEKGDGVVRSSPATVTVCTVALPGLS